MKLFTYKSEEAAKEMERTGVLVPKYYASRMNSWGQYIVDNIFSIFSIAGVIPLSTMRKAVFLFPEGYGKTEWTHSNTGVATTMKTPLEQLMCQIRERQKEEGPVHIFSFEPGPDDPVTVFDYNFMRKQYETANSEFSEDIDLTFFRSYFSSGMPLWKYDGSHKMPEALCFDPIPKSRLKLEETIHTYKEMAIHVNRLL